MSSAPHDDSGQEKRVKPDVPSRSARSQALTTWLRREAVISTPQLRTLGYSRDAIWWLVKHGELERLHHGVYTDGRTRPGPTTRLKAALLAAGPTAFLSHRTAAAARGFRLINTRDLHVTIVAKHTRKLPGLELHRTAGKPGRGEVSTVAGLRVATVPRILLDLAAAGAGDGELRDLIKQAERRSGLPEVWTILEHHPRRPGTKRLRRLLAHHRPVTEHNSTFEDEFWAWYAGEGLPAPDDTNVHIGPYEFDAIFHDARLVIELDSRRYHQARADMDHDREKDAYVQLHGHRVLRITEHHFNEDRPWIRRHVLAFCERAA